MTVAYLALAALVLGLVVAFLMRSREPEEVPWRDPYTDALAGGTR